ncbi:ATP-dependent DNA helicase RecG [Spiribacter vilamensis]|uniref:ATP-dependent DNA helicase RecG n=1 Tax=Spiribacter vilamensis TaxID=531306 RepID=A0A4Q8D1V1_9GAMM|nr:ATP-dependent DNA helicase RecG [Spiribacter vilamensis]RZU99250.1 ATP-dependent DNA helicase RecG [Spiribacter vilamensis]TVO61763.1 ATP-dependent DNA helicase RecG [Spiribacter vilamensis]
MSDGAAVSGTPVVRLPGIGPRLAEKLARLGLKRVEDMPFHLPIRYEDRTRVLAIGSLRPGISALIEGEVTATEIVGGQRRRLICRISDGTGSLELVFFHFYASQQRQMARGVHLRVFGEARAGPVVLQLIHPDWQRVEPGSTPAEGEFKPVYPATEGITQPALRRAIGAALAQPGAVTEWLPGALRESMDLPPLEEALALVHAPPADADPEALLEGRHPAIRRLAFEELLAHRLSLLRLRAEQQQVMPAPVIPRDEALIGRFLGGLGFDLTGAQRRVHDEVVADLGRQAPMLRLVQGDVGSGKTVVAALAALHVVAAGWQVAIMAPTELLAEQHERSFRDWLEPLGLRVGWLSGRAAAARRRDTLAGLADGDIQVVVGTHVLFQADVVFRSLGLVVIDEQHRFGVHQRLALRDKGSAQSQPHQLVMTATPIPRTLAMTAYADLDSSVIDELPPGRLPVQTVALPDTRREAVIERIRAVGAEGRQAYWVCTLVEDSDVLEAEAAEATAERLREQLPALAIGLVHGRLPAAEKEAVMARFEAGEVDLLVATTVIEVGVNVPNASLMIIENAERLGLSQLHQLRGRVGRGHAQSSCVLLYHGALGETARSRLGVMRESNDGFRIARRDLEIRGPGEVLGTRQTGALTYRIADLMRDGDLLDSVQSAAQPLLRDEPAAVSELIRRWVGEGERYAQV